MIRKGKPGAGCKEKATDIAFTLVKAQKISMFLSQINKFMRKLRERKYLPNQHQSKTR